MMFSKLFKPIEIGSLQLKNRGVMAEELKGIKVNFKVIGDAVKPRKIFEAVKEGFEAAYEI